MSSVELVSVHIPKTGGGSLEQILRGAYGNSLQLDYTYAAESIADIPEDTRAVHGHIRASTYRTAFPKAKMITFLREPIDRLRSHFFFWRAAYETFDEIARSNPLARAVFHKEVGFYEFAQHHQMRNHVSRAFLDVDIEKEFYFVGLFEHFREELKALQGMLGTSENHTPHVRKTSEYAKENAELLAEYRDFKIETEERKNIISSHHEDYALYETARQMYGRRVAASAALLGS